MARKTAAVNGDRFSEKIPILAGTGRLVWRVLANKERGPWGPDSHGALLRSRFSAVHGKGQTLTEPNPAPWTHIDSEGQSPETTARAIEDRAG